VQEIFIAAKKLHERIDALMRTSAKRDRPTVVTLYSLNDGESGQWIIGDEDQDQLTVAKRLRLAADILERRAAA
jgi:hypothetical protein